MTVDWDSLTHAASEVRNHAHAPYSGFRVGAALQTDDGRIFAGCNVENASYGATICAERVALGCAVSAGARVPIALVIATDSKIPTPPCGLCRQSFVELSPELVIRSRTTGGQVAEYRLRELLPHAFDRDQLG